MQTLKAQIRLHIHAVWSGPSLSAYWIIGIVTKIMLLYSEGPNQLEYQWLIKGKLIHLKTFAAILLRETTSEDRKLSP